MKINLNNPLSEEELADFLELLKLAPNLGLVKDGKKGDKGDDGKNVYELWLKNGNTGSLRDFLISLVGKPGKDGEDGLDGDNGLSIYDLWLKAGNKGSLKQFLESLKGLPGKPGKNGDPGKDGEDGILDFKWDGTKLCIWSKEKQEYICQNLAGKTQYRKGGWVGGGGFSANTGKETNLIEVSLENTTLVNGVNEIILPLSFLNTYDELIYKALIDDILVKTDNGVLIDNQEFMNISVETGVLHLKRNNKKTKWFILNATL